MAYGTLKCDNITFTNGGVDQTVTVSGIVQSISGNITATGTIQGATIIGTSTVSGGTVTGNTVNAQIIYAGSGVFGSGIFASGLIASYKVNATTGVFQDVSLLSLSGTYITGDSGVYTTQLSGATITGNIGSFTTVTGGVATITSGVFALGEAALPSISFSSDPDTGIYSPGADQLALSTNGTGRLFVDASGNVLINDSASVTSNVSAYLRIRQANAAADTSIGIINAQNSDANATVKIQAGQYTRRGGEIIFGRENGADWTNANAADGYIAFSPVVNGSNTERLRIDSSGRLLVGTSSTFDAGCQFQIVGNITQAAQFFRIGGNDNTTVYIGSARGTTGTPLVLTNADIIGTLAFRSYDGSAYANGATIKAEIDGITPSNDLPTRLVFSTTPDGDSSPDPRMTIDSSGYVRLSSNSPGIQFNGDTAAANALDDYEEGTFTPTITGTTIAGTGTYSVQNGFYTKIGNLVNFTLRLVWSAHTGTGNIQVSGLPFASSASADIRFAVFVYHENLALTAGNVLESVISVNSAAITVSQVPTGGGATASIPMDTAAQIVATGSYRVP